MFYLGEHVSHILCDIGPREVSVVRKSAVSLIFGPQSKCSKSTWYAQASTDPKSCSIHHTRDVDDHRKRRKAWDRGLSVKGKCSSRVRMPVTEQRIAPISSTWNLSVADQDQSRLAVGADRGPFGPDFRCDRLVHVFEFRYHGRSRIR